MEDTAIKDLFRIRDRAVKNKDERLFLSTQIREIPGSGSAGYLSTDALKTTILNISSEDAFKLTKTVAVKETYFVKGKKSHEGILIYHLVNTIQGWKIYNIVY